MSMRNKITDFYVFIMLLVYPLVPGTKGYMNITETKFWFWIGLTALWILSLIVFSVKERRLLGRLNPAQVFAIGFILVCIVSILLSDYGKACLKGFGRYDGFVTLGLYSLTLILVAAFGRFREMHLIALSISVTVCSIVSFLQLLGINALWLFPYDYVYYDAHIKFASEFLGTIGNADLLASMLCLAVPFFAGMYIIRGNRSVWLLVPLFFATATTLFAGVAAGIVGCGVMVLVLMPMLLTDSERVKNAFLCLVPVLLAAALWLGFKPEYTVGNLTLSFVFTKLCILSIVGAILCGVIFALPVWGKVNFEEKIYRRFFILLDVAIILAGLAVLYLWPGEEGTMYEMSQVLHGNLDPKFGSSRIMIWNGVFPLVPEKPIFGAGPGTISQRLDISFSRLVEETGNTLSVRVDNAHSVYLQILADTGLAGLVCYVSSLVCACMLGIRKHAPIVLAVICYCVQDIFGLGLFLTAPLLWIFAGLAASNASLGGFDENEMLS